MNEGNKLAGFKHPKECQRGGFYSVTTWVIRKPLEYVLRFRSHIKCIKQTKSQSRYWRTLCPYFRVSERVKINMIQTWIRVQYVYLVIWWQIQGWAQTACHNINIPSFQAWSILMLSAVWYALLIATEKWSQTNAVLASAPCYAVMGTAVVVMKPNMTADAGPTQISELN